MTTKKKRKEGELRSRGESWMCSLPCANQARSKGWLSGRSATVAAAADVGVVVKAAVGIVRLDPQS